LQDFKYPKNFEIQCLAKPSIFSYPKRLEEKKEEKKKRVETVMLSTTAKEKARLARRKAKEESLGIEASGRILFQLTLINDIAQFVARAS